MQADQVIQRRQLVALAQAEGTEKALRCAFFEGQIAALEQLAKDFRASDTPGDECYGWGAVAAERIERFLIGN